MNILYLEWNVWEYYTKLKVKIRYEVGKLIHFESRRRGKNCNHVQKCVIVMHTLKMGIYSLVVQSIRPHINKHTDSNKTNNNNT